MKAIDLTGKRYGRLTVLEKCENAKSKRLSWKCVCDCGNITIVQGNNLRSGNTKSCGCFQEHHNMRKSKLYGVWNSMKNRCYNPNVTRYKNYGGRGIKVCDEWASSFSCFSKWAFESGYKEGLTIDRIDANGNYTPQNCRWVDIKSQQSNRTNNLLIEIDGETHTITEWGRISPVCRQTIYRRYKKGIRGKGLIEK